MSVNGYLANLSSDLVLSSDENEKIKTSINYLEERLDYYFDNEIKEKFRFGSSTRGTILPRKVDEKSDIDYMIVFDNEQGFKPQAFLDRIKKFVENYYSKSEIHQDSPTIVLELNHIKFELVPAYKQYGVYYISNGHGGWMRTNPNDFNDKLIKVNKFNNSLIKPIIRLIKYWNIKKCFRYYDSYQLEELLVNNMEYSYVTCSTYYDYILYALKVLKNNETYGTSQYNKIQKSINKLEESVDDETKYPALYLDELKEIFPEI